MTEHTTGGQPEGEPDLLRDQFKQLLRYRLLIVLGVVLGLAGGGWIALASADSYVATSEVTVRSATADPFAPGTITPDKQVSIGSERQTAASNAVASRAAKDLGMRGHVTELQSGLQVTNPLNTLLLRFSYTASTPRMAAERANAFTKAYLDYREEQTRTLIDNMIKGYQKQLKPLVKQHKAQDSQSSLAGRISELNSSIAKLKALDITPGFVVRTATPPTSPSGPPLPLLLGLGACVGVAIGLLAAWVRLVFDPAVRSEGDLGRSLRAPVLGTLPRTRRRREDADTLPAKGRVAEEYRSVAFRLAYDHRFANRRRLLVVAPRGGIDTAAAVSVNLAAAFGEMGRETLLVEADLRTPGLAARLRDSDGTRLVWSTRIPQLSGGTWPTGERIVVEAGESGAFGFIPGARVHNAARALTSAPVTQLIATADARDSVVVVLAPAALSYADAIALADRVDGVLVVCNPRKVRRDDLSRIRELVTGAGGTVLGALLHDEDTPDARPSQSTRDREPGQSGQGEPAPRGRGGARGAAGEMREARPVQGTGGRLPGQVGQGEPVPRGHRGARRGVPGKGPEARPFQGALDQGGPVPRGRRGARRAAAGDMPAAPPAPGTGGGSDPGRPGRGEPDSRRRRGARDGARAEEEYIAPTEEDNPTATLALRRLDRANLPPRPDRS
ncbi:lipopolysaccharide biosynthesis protein [Streptomyces sp. V4I8]|uniref:polysaccharide biosynthesis tyrosine autokinase n=1 Tax=Streptomyces sp. V4I8 TaxID=3156469 RepID=UPI003516A89E